MQNNSFTDLRGVWRSRGYGTVLVIGRRGYTLYEETRVSCLKAYEGTLDELQQHYVDVSVSPQGKAFTARRAAGVTRMNFRRLAAWPQACAPRDPEDRHEPGLNFEVFWNTFAERYALFELRGVDWNAAYETYRPRVDERTSRARLFELFTEMTHPLRDGHVRLHTPCGHFNAGAPPLLHDRLARELDATGDTRDVPSFLAELRETQSKTIDEVYLGGAPHRAANRVLHWGQLDENTGYLAIRAMAGLCGSVGRPGDDLQACDAAMRRVLTRLGHLPRWVVDVRGNGGGYDGVALRLAGYLTDRKRLAYTKAARHGTGYTGKQAVYVEPSDRDRYAGDIFLLTSGLTASAAEVFVLALLQHPRVTRLGEATDGILSDMMERHLPNQWLVTLSNELYRAADDELYEDRGIPPHIEMRYLDRTGRQPGRDPMLDYVLAHA